MLSCRLTIRFHRFWVLYLQASWSFSLLVVVSHSIFFVLSEWYLTCALQVYVNAMLAQYVFLEYLVVIDADCLSPIMLGGWMLERDSRPWLRHRYCRVLDRMNRRYNGRSIESCNQWESDLLLCIVKILNFCCKLDPVWSNCQYNNRAYQTWNMISSHSEKKMK